MKRVTLTRAAAALGAACLLLAPTAFAARADEAPLPIYNAAGIAQGIITTFALRPSILDPLLQAGTNYASSSISSQGDGQAHSVAAQVYPGSIILGALGCPSPLPGVIQASYPTIGTCPKEAHSTLFSIPLQSGNPDFDAALNSLAQFTNLAVSDLRVKAQEGAASSFVQTQKFLLQGDSKTPILSVGNLKTDNDATRVGKKVENVVTSTAKDISLLGGMIQIGSLTSESSASSDGTTGVAKGTFTLAGVSVLVNGERHSASIDNTGLHVSDPGLSRQQNIGLTDQVSEVLAGAGVQLTAAKPTDIIDGASGESSVGGLIIGFDVGVPAFQIPDEVGGAIAQIINNIPTQCLSDFGIPAPICFGPGVIPGPGSEAHMTFTIGATDAFAVGGIGFNSTPGGVCTTCAGSPVGPPTAVSSNFQSQPPAPGPVPSVSTPAPSGPLRLFGLVARLPAVVLLWLGIGLLLVAVASAFRPSLRHAGRT
jgi:hypothetical protein